LDDAIPPTSCLFFKVVDPGFITSGDPRQKASISLITGQEI
jgi:hypothetical protein